MAVLKCKMCGGELTIREGVSIVKCDYCGNTNTLPKENSVNNHDLFARANELRARCEFDLAERAYEKIIEVAPQEAEAYWGLVLCQYGIEYVEDPKTKKRIPTCHRASFEAITADYNYQKAIEYADVVSRPVYEEEARVIDAIQKEILALSYKEEKYDVFICYKETDNDGKRTEDSAIANDIYYQLTQEGYKVFYAAITLEDKLGQDYEPIIFAALNSAKVMLVVGTKTEYFNAVWVKNEWSRFLKIMKQDRTKLMFPCYKGISAYELPDELSHMQAQDMGKIGFINDLIRGIKKVIVKEKPKTEASSEVVATKVAPSKMNPTLRRAFIFIEDGNWEEANEYLEKVLDDEPENAFAYLGKLLIDLKVKKQEKLADLAQTFDNNPNYKKAYKYADKDLKEKLAGYNEAISKRNEEKSKDEQYSAALTFASKAKTEEDYKQAGKKFAALSGWKDSSRRAKDCFDKAETIRKDAIYTKALGLAQSKDPNTIKQAIPLFESIPDWKDSAELLIKIPELCEVARKNSIYEDADRKYNSTNIAQVKEAQVLFLSIETWRDSKQKAESCVKRIQELEEKAEQERIAHEKAERERRIAEEKKKKLIKKVSIISGSAVVAIVTVIILLVTLIIPTIKFNKATELFNAGKYDEAVAIYNELDGFGSSNNKLNVIEGIKTVEDGDYEEGIEKLLENGTTVTISYDCAGGDLSTNNTKSVKTKNTAYSSGAIIANADEQGNNFTYTSLNEFEGLKPSTRNGYTFNKWTLVTCLPQISKDNNKVSLTFIAEWTAKSYTVTYDLDGGSVNGENIIGYNPDDESFTLINPTRTGYTFIGWTGTELTDKTMEVTVASGSYGNREYTANWQADTYTVTYNANGGTASKTEDTATYDEGFTLATVERKGYTFLGWFVGQTKCEDFDNWELTNGLDLVAEWKINTYSITYTLNGGSATNTETYTVEDTVVINAPEKTGYTFDGWTGTGLSEKTKSITLAKGTIDNKEYTANWTAKTYQVTFNANGGTASKTEDTATYDSNFTLATAERRGYEFVAWKADGVIYTSGDWKTDKNVDLVAEWKIKDYEITYHLDGGSVEGNPTTYTLNDTVTLMNPTKIGYTFTGWTGTDLSGKTMTVTIAKDSIGNREFTATWTANIYKVTYNANGGTASKTEDIATFDGDFTLATADRKGYEFVAWKADGKTFANGVWKTAKDIELIAEWKIINYTISYDLAGGGVEGNPETYTVEDAITLIAPERTGYAFAGWTGTGLTDRTMSVAISKGSIGEREYTANWTANTYTLTYNVNGGDALAENTQSATYDADYFVVEPTRTGYSFVQWATSAGTVYSGGVWKTASNVIVIAEWSANEYTVTFDDISKKPNFATITYDYNYSGSTSTVETLYNGDILEYPTNPTRNDYIFTGWYTTADCATKYDFTGIITEDMTLHAGWTTCTITNNSSYPWTNSNGTLKSTNTGNNSSSSYRITATTPVTISFYYSVSSEANYDKLLIEKNGNTLVTESGSKTNVAYSIDLNGGDYLTFTYSKDSSQSNGSDCATISNIVYTSRVSYTSTATATTASDSEEYAYASGEEYSMSVVYDNRYTLPAPTRTGYTFGGWLNNGVVVNDGEWKIAYDVTLTANWIPVEYSITYYLNGGSVNGNLEKYTMEDSVTLINPTRAGYTFVGWTGTGLNELTTNLTIESGSIGPREYTANWEATQYSVTYCNTNSIFITFDYNGLNKENKIIALNEAKDFVLEENVLRDGYIFTGWYTNKEATKAFDYNMVIKENTTLYAGWFKLETGDRRNNLVVTNATFSFYRSLDRYSYPTYTYPYFVAKKGGSHTLTCRGSGSELWKVDIVVTNLTTGKEIYYDTPSSSSSSPTIITFDCRQGDVIQIYSTTGFSSNGGVSFYFTYENFNDGNVLLWNEDVVYFEQECISQDVVYDEEYIAYKPYRNGYVFDAWYDENGNKYENGIWKTAKDVVLTAKWIPNSYTVIYNSGLGVASKESQTVIMGEATTLATATRDGYDFLGWYYNGVLVSNGEWTIADNITLEAKWELEYKTPYQVNHYKQNIEDDNYTLFEELNLLGQINQVVTPAVNTYEGFTSPSAKTVTVLEDGSVVVDYYYTRNKYQLKYVSNGGTVDSTTMVKYGTPLSLLVPEKDNRTFGGWFTDIGLTNRFTQSTMPAQATTLYAWWQEETKANEFMYSGTSTVTIAKYNGTSGSIVIPSHIAGSPVTTIASEAFLDNQVITSIIVPNAVTKIQTKAFSGCSNLTTIVLPVSLVSIEEQAFFGCSSLTTVYYMGASTDWGNISIVSNFYLTNANRYYYSKEEPALNSDSTSYNGNYWRYVDGVPTPWIYEG